LNKEIPEEYRHYLEKRASSSQEAGRHTAITLRSLLVGCLLCALIAVGVPYGGMIIQGTRLGLSSSTPAAFFLLFVLLLSVHLLLGQLKRRWAFQWGELVTIFFMMTVATAIPTRGVTGVLLPMITGTFYYDTPENKWAELIHPHIARWMVVDDPQAVKEFYEGSLGAVAIPWSSWLPVLLCWLVFYMGLYLTVISLLVVLRRQWVDDERLPYPLIQVPLAMIDEGDGGKSLLKPFFRNRVMWYGFAIPFFLNSLNALHHYYPAVASINFEQLASIFSLRLEINFLMLGLAYLINCTIAFSLLFFYLLHELQEHILYLMGMGSKEEVLGTWTDPIMGHQMMGALIVLVFYGLWNGRSHIKNVFLKALRPNSQIDDSAEIMSYRSALLGSAFGMCIMGIWLYLSGIPAWVVPFVIFAGLVIFIALARVVTEVGLSTVTPGMVPAGFVISGIGVPALGIKGMIATSFTLAWVGDLLVFMAAPLANGLRMSKGVTGNRRLLFWAIGLAIFISLSVSTWFTLYLAYRYGGINLHSQYFSLFATIPPRLAAQKLAQPTGPSLNGWLWIGAGGGIMAALMALRHKLTWWPFHPLGFAVSMGWIMDTIWFSIFLAWLFKVVILKYGGASVYQKSKPFFLGLALGQIVTGGIWLIIDGLTGTVGHRIRVY
jgi:hypothetical protein